MCFVALLFSGNILGLCLLLIARGLHLDALLQFLLCLFVLSPDFHFFFQLEYLCESLHVLSGEGWQGHLFVHQPLHSHVHLVVLLPNEPRVFLVCVHIFLDDSRRLLVFTGFVIWAYVLWVQQVPLLDEERSVDGGFQLVVGRVPRVEVIHIYGVCESESKVADSIVLSIDLLVVYDRHPRFCQLLLPFY